jgi:glycosyltransferase involved in cell wall biosynthesis
MKRKLLPIVVPFYQENFELFLDFVDSINTYIKTEYQLIVVDDFSQDGSYEKLLDFQSKNNNVTVLRNSRNLGWGWGLWLTIGAGLTWAHQNLEYDYVLKLDCDALLINYDIHQLTSEAYKNPKAGLIGCFGSMHEQKWFWDFRVGRKWKQLAKRNGFFNRAKTHGAFWAPQEGAMTIGAGLVGKMVENDVFVIEKNCGGIYKRLLGTHGLYDGPFFSILCYAFGYEAVEFPIFFSQFLQEEIEKIPFELYRPMGVRVIHPIKASKNIGDFWSRIRGYFKQERQEDKTNGKA